VGEYFGCMRVLFLLTLLFLCSCGSRSLEDYRREGQESARSLTTQLRTIQSRQDLVNSAPKIKAGFNRLVDVMIAAQDFYQSHPESVIPELTEEDREYSQELRFEINRILRIEGTEKLMTNYREEAHHRLHLFQTRLEEKKIKFH